MAVYVTIAKKYVDPAIPTEAETNRSFMVAEQGSGIRSSLTPISGGQQGLSGAIYIGDPPVVYSSPELGAASASLKNQLANLIEGNYITVTTYDTLGGAGTTITAVAMRTFAG